VDSVGNTINVYTAAGFHAKVCIVLAVSQMQQTWLVQITAQYILIHCL